MNRGTPRLRRIAKRLMVAEAKVRRSVKDASASSFPVTDKLRPHLATLVGNSGVRALLARALALAAREVTWLDAVQVNAAGEFEGLETLGARRDPAEFLEGRIVLLAELLGLLVAFIGPGLTSRLMGEIWPQVPLKHLDFGEEQ